MALGTSIGVLLDEAKLAELGPVNIAPAGAEGQYSPFEAAWASLMRTLDSGTSAQLDELTTTTQFAGRHVRNELGQLISIALSLLPSYPFYGYPLSGLFRLLPYLLCA